MQRAAIYARYSTDLQSDRSVEDQIALCQEHARRAGLAVAGEYHDRARSGATVAGRPGLASLMADAEAGRFTVVIVEALDRLSRDQADLATIYKRLTFIGVDIVAVHDGRADIVQVGIRGLVSALFLDDLKHKIRRGMTGVVADGRSAGGRAYGYRPVPGQPGELQIEEGEAEVVRRIFREYVDGASSLDIVAALNRDGIPAPRSAEWTPSTITGNRRRGYGILRNALYDGRLVWNRVRMIRHPETGKRVSRENPPSEWREIAVEDLRIVPADLFAAAQAHTPARETRRIARRKTRILSGLLRCHQCGDTLAVHDTRNGVIRVKCTGAAQKGTCDNRRRYSLQPIEAAVIDGVREQLAHPAALQAFIEGFLEERRGGARERARAEKRAAEAKAAVYRLNDMLVDGRIDTSYFDAKIGALRAAQVAAEAALVDIPDPGPVTLHPAAVAAHARALEQIAGRLADPDTADPELMHLFRELIDRVVVEHDEDGGVTAAVYGRLGPLVTPWGDRLVAEVRYQRLPPLFFGRFAA